jgi:hypothetical protein
MSIVVYPIGGPAGAAGPSGTGSIFLSAGTLSNQSSGFTFGNSNGVSFGLQTNGVITATVRTDFQSTGAYLTTAALSQNTSNYAGLSTAATNASITVNTAGIAISVNPGGSGGAGIGFTSASTAGTAITATLSTNGLSMGLPAYLTTAQPAGAYLTTAALSQDSSKYAGVNGAITGGSITVNTSGVSINIPSYLTTAQPPGAYLTTAQPVGAYLTTAGLSQDSSKYAGTAAAITGGSITHNTAGISINLPSYLTTAQSPGAYLTTAALSQDSSKYAGVSTGMAGGSVTLNTAGISISLPAYLTTAQSPGAYLTTADLSQNSSKYAGINGSITGGSITVNTSGVSIALPSYLTTAQPVGAYLTTAALSGDTTKYAGVSTGIAGGSVTLNTAGISISLPAYLTTAALSQNTSNYAGISTGAVNASVTLNTAGISISVAAPGGGGGAGTGTSVATTAGTDLSFAVNTSGVTIAYPKWITAAGASPVNISAGTMSNNLGSMVFANSNGVSFGLNSGVSSQSLTASIATTYAGTGITTATTAGVNIAGTNDTSGLNLGIPAYLTTAALSYNTSNYAGLNVGAYNCSVTANTSGISVSVANPLAGWVEPYPMTNTALFGPVAGSWYFAPFQAPEDIGGGRINLLHINTSTANLFRDITGASYNSNSTGTLNQSLSYEKRVAIYSQGAGANSTRLESLWSSNFSFAWSKIVQVALSQASNINISVAHSISYISDIGSDGARTLNQFASSNATSIANSSTASNWGDTIAASLRNMVSNSIMECVPLNTTIGPGGLWLAFMWNTSRGSASTGGALASALDFAVSSECGISRLILESAYRNWGSTVTTARSHIMPYGVYTAGTNVAPPQYVNLSSDLSSIASAWIPYFNFQVNGLTK